MRKLLAILSVLFTAALVLTAPVGAQTATEDTVIGSITADPPVVAEAGEYEITGTGSGFIPDSEILFSTCTAPGDTLVLGEVTLEDVSAALGSIDALANCDLANAQAVAVDSDGNWTASGTFTIGDNFALTAGALDGSQAGSTWVPIGDAALLATLAPPDLAVTGVDSWAITLFGIGLVALGAGALYGSRRFELA